MTRGGRMKIVEERITHRFIYERKKISCRTPLYYCVADLISSRALQRHQNETITEGLENLNEVAVLHN